MKSRDMTKIGYLYLNDGVWARKRTLTTEWIQESTKYQVQVGDSLGKLVKGYGFF